MSPRVPTASRRGRGGSPARTLYPARAQSTISAVAAGTIAAGLAGDLGRHTAPAILSMPSLLRHVRPLFAAAAAAALLSLPAVVEAQRSVIRGRVVVLDSLGAPLAATDVGIAALGRGTRTGEDGSFVLDALPAGTHELYARRLGHSPLSRRVTLAGEADTVTILLTLSPMAVGLAQVEVREQATAPAAPALRAFERERALSNGGAFIGDSILARLEHSSMSNVLRRIPGAMIVRYPSSRGAYNVIGSRRGSVSIRGGNPVCLFQIYVDGQRRFAPASVNVEPPPDVDEFKVADYEAIEIYRGAAQTPMQYSGTGNPCGTILFWSRTRR